MISNAGTTKAEPRSARDGFLVAVSDIGRIMLTYSSFTDADPKRGSMIVFNSGYHTAGGVPGNVVDGK